MRDHELIELCLDIIILISKKNYRQAKQTIKILNDHILDAL